MTTLQTINKYPLAPIPRTWPTKVLSGDRARGTTKPRKRYRVTTPSNSSGSVNKRCQWLERCKVELTRSKGRNALTSRPSSIKNMFCGLRGGGGEGERVY